MKNSKKLKWINKGDYDFTTYTDDYGTTHDIYLYHNSQKRIVKGKEIIFNRLEIESLIGFDNEQYNYAFYYMNDKLIKSE